MKYFQSCCSGVMSRPSMHVFDNTAQARVVHRLLMPWCQANIKVLCKISSPILDAVPLRNRRGYLYASSVLHSCNMLCRLSSRAMLMSSSWLLVPRDSWGGFIICKPFHVCNASMGARDCWCRSRSMICSACRTDSGFKLWRELIDSSVRRHSVGCNDAK
jgi:hypothetical protein